MNLLMVGTRSTASLTSCKYGDAVERAPTRLRLSKVWSTGCNLALEVLLATVCLGVLKAGHSVLFQGRARLAAARM